MLSCMWQGPCRSFVVIFKSLLDNKIKEKVVECPIAKKIEILNLVLHTHCCYYNLKIMGIMEGLH